MPQLLDPRARTMAEMPIARTIVSRPASAASACTKERFAKSPLAYRAASAAISPRAPAWMAPARDKRRRGHHGGRRARRGHARITMCAAATRQDVARCGARGHCAPPVPVRRRGSQAPDGTSKLAAAPGTGLQLETGVFRQQLHLAPHAGVRAHDIAHWLPARQHNEPGGYQATGGSG